MLQVEELQHVEESRCLHVSTDGVDRIKGEITGLEMVNLVKYGDLMEGSLMRVIKSFVRRVDGAKYLCITLLEVLSAECAPSQISDVMEDVQEARSNAALRIPSPSTIDQKRK